MGRFGLGLGGAGDDRDAEGEGLAGAGGGTAADVAAGEGVGDGGGLDLEGLGHAVGGEGIGEARGDAQVGEGGMTCVGSRWLRCWRRRSSSAADVTRFERRRATVALPHRCRGASSTRRGSQHDTGRRPRRAHTSADGVLGTTSQSLDSVPPCSLCGSTDRCSTLPRRRCPCSTTVSPSATVRSRPCAPSGGVPFAMTRHLRRLRRSLDGLGLELDRSDDELARLRCARSPTRSAAPRRSASPSPVAPDRSVRDGTRAR